MSIFNVERDAVPVGLLGNQSTTLTVVSGDTLYYADNSQVSATNNQGFLTAGGASQTFTNNVWIVSASASSVSQSFTAASGGSGGSVASTGALNGNVSGPGGAPGVSTGATPIIATPSNFALWWGVMNANPVITLPTPVQGDRFVLRLDQDATGGRTPSFAGATVEWPAGTQSWITTASASNWTSLECADGIKWQAFPLTGGVVTSVFTRGGAVTAQQGDYAAFYEPQWVNVVGAPGAKFPTAFNTASTFSTAFVPRGHRVVVPKAGTLHDISWMPAVASGNCALAIYDTGDASAGNRSLLWSSGSLVVGTANTWQTADPAITVYAGQQLDFLLTPDNTTASFYRFFPGIGQNSAMQLPNTSFNPVTGGAAPKLIITAASIGALTTWPATIAEASVTLTSAAPFMIARVA